MNDQNVVDQRSADLLMLHDSVSNSVVSLVIDSKDGLIPSARCQAPGQEFPHQSVTPKNTALNSTSTG